MILASFLFGASEPQGCGGLTLHDEEDESVYMVVCLYIFCICMYIYILVYIYVRMYVYILVYVYLCIYQLFSSFFIACTVFVGVGERTRHCWPISMRKLIMQFNCYFQILTRKFIFACLLFI